MKPKQEKLFEAYKNLLKVRGECAHEIFSECTVSDLTVKQIEYLKIIDRHSDMTFSMLADLTKNSKPTITEMINKFLTFNCVFRERSCDDGRVSYIHLTEEGKKIARHEQITIQKVVNRMMNSLDTNEIDLLISIFNKMK